MHALLIVNPNATSTTRAARDLLAHALESRVQLTVAHTEHRGHAAELAQWAVSQRMDLVAVHGGDGTVNEAINGLLPAPELLDSAEPSGRSAGSAPAEPSGRSAGSAPAEPSGRSAGSAPVEPSGRWAGSAPWAPQLAVLPGGSANVFARSLGIDPDPVVATNQLIDLLALGTHRRVGLGHADGRWFAFNAGLGLDAEVCEAIDNSRAKGRTASPARYVRTAVRKFLAAQRSEPALTVELPGREPIEGIHYALVSNSSPWTYLNGRPVRTNPGTSFDSGLGVFAMQSVGVWTTLRMVRQLLLVSRGPVSPQLVRADDVPGVRIRSNRPIALQMDGDYVGTRRVVDFTARPAALQVVAPKLG